MEGKGDPTPFLTLRDELEVGESSIEIHIPMTTMMGSW